MIRLRNVFAYSVAQSCRAASIKTFQSKIKNRSLAAIPLLFVALSATALTPATLLTPELESRSINLSGLSGGTLSYFDAERRLTRSAVGEFVRLKLDGRSPSIEGSAAPLGGVIELVDGQRIAGRWSGASRDGEAILWANPTLGRFTLGLDDVRRVAMTLPLPDGLDPVPNLGTPAGDTVFLRNGDRFVGFIVAVADDSVTIQPDGAEDQVTLARDNIAMLELANPLTPPQEAVVAGDLIELVSGTRVRGGGVSIRGDALSFTPTLTDAMQRVELTMDRVVQIDFAASGLRLVDLGEQPMTTVAGGSAFGLELLPTVDPEGIRLHAPVAVVFDLPDGAQRFTSRAVLDLPVGLAQEQARLADVLIRAWPGGADSSVPTASEAGGVRLLLDRPWSMIGGELSGADQLRIELDPMNNGPILDRVRLEDAMILVVVPDPRPGSGDADP